MDMNFQVWIVFVMVAVCFGDQAHALESGSLSNLEIIRLFHRSQDKSQLINFQLNGGTHALGQLLEQSGGSRSIGDFFVPYSMTATAERLRKVIDRFDQRSLLKADSESLRKFSYSSEEAACAHAEDAYRRGLSYRAEESTRREKEITRVLAIGSASALAYFSRADLSNAEFKRGEHRAHVCSIEDRAVHAFELVFPPEFVSDFMQKTIAEAKARHAGVEFTPEQIADFAVEAAAQLRKVEEDTVTRFLLVQLASRTVDDFHDTDSYLSASGLTQLRISARTLSVDEFAFVPR